MPEPEVLVTAVLVTARKADARQRVSQRVQNENEGETEHIIFYLYSIKF